MGTAASTTVQRDGGYDVPRPAGLCAASGRAIAPDEKFVAALRETPTGLERLDISQECWETFDRSALLGYWQTVMPRGETKKKIFVDDEVLCTLFERLGDADEPNKLHFRFVLGLILMRKRLVIYEDRRQAGENDVWLVRMKGKDQTLELIDPRLDERQITEVSQQIGEILSQEL